MTDKTPEEIAAEVKKQDELDVVNDEALLSGYGDGEFKVSLDDYIPGEEPDEDEDLDEPKEEPKEDPKEEPKVEPEEKKEAKKEPDEKKEVKDEKKGDDEDEWKGVSTAMRERVEKAERQNSSDIGRIKALQTKLTDAQKAAIKPDKPVPSPDQLRAAMTDKKKMAELKTEWPGHAEALEESMDVVGERIDRQANEFQVKISASEQKANKNLLDINHKGWENIIDGDDFSTWVYEGGPNAEEQAAYNLLRTSGKLEEADTYYAGMMNRHTVWAEDRGKLYGSPEVVDSIDLLTLYKAAQQEEKDNKDSSADEQREAEAEARRKKLEDNVTPTDGKGGSHTNATQSADEAFEAGFSGT